MFSVLIQEKCPLCSRLCSGLRKFFYRLIGRIDCRGINQRTYKKENRVSEINTAAPGCACEQYRMSKYSPCPVDESETLVRFVFSPLHINKSGGLKPSLFSHVETKGCSIQRDSKAKIDEIVTFVKNFLAKRDDFSWIGVVFGQCRCVRGIKAGESSHRAVCVFDTAEKNNPAHGEMCQTQYIVEEADRLELRRNLFAAFGERVVIEPSQYRDGAVWTQLPQHLQARRTKR